MSIRYKAIIFNAALQVAGEFVRALVIGGDHCQRLLPDRALVQCIQQLEDTFPRSLGLSILFQLINCRKTCQTVCRGFESILNNQSLQLCNEKS
jgi:hypothetical protein